MPQDIENEFRSLFPRMSMAYIGYLCRKAILNLDVIIKTIANPISITNVARSSIRKIHPTYLGYVDIKSSEKGETCGLVKKLSIKSKNFKLIQKKKEYSPIKLKYNNNYRRIFRRY